MLIIRNILSGVTFMLYCRCCGELFGPDCDVYCKLDGCVH